MVRTVEADRFVEVRSDPVIRLDHRVEGFGGVGQRGPVALRAFDVWEHRHGVPCVVAVSEFGGISPGSLSKLVQGVFVDFESGVLQVWGPL